MPERVNLFHVELSVDADDPPRFNEVGYARIGPRIGASAIGMTVYELPPGTSNCPYHYEVGNEEWVLVLEGQLTVRTPAGEQELGTGDVLCFPDGETGSHKVTNNGESPARIALLSTKNDPSSTVYPDSGKIGVWPLGKLFRLRDAVGYWEGEP